MSDDFGAFVPGEHHIELSSGRYLDLSDPNPVAITLEDVAQGLANTCRFAGQPRRFYSVAEHCVLVASKLVDDGEPSEVVLAGLHHDDAEAFLGDVTRPLKALLPAYRDLEESVGRAIEEALHVPVLDPPDAVKAADDWALAAEAYHLLPSQGRTWFCAGLYERNAGGADDTRLFGDTPPPARDLWLYLHNELMNVAA